MTDGVTSAARQRRIAGGQACPDCDEVVSVIDAWCRFCGARLPGSGDSEGVYLAGPINHVRDNGRGWREYLIEEVDDVAFVNPLDINDDHDLDPDAPVPTWVIDADLKLVAGAAVVLAWLPFDTPSRGTEVELWEAGLDPGTDVIVWVDTAPERYSPFVRGPADEFVYSAEEAIDAVRDSVEVSSDGE